MKLYLADTDEAIAFTGGGFSQPRSINMPVWIFRAEFAPEEMSEDRQVNEDQIIDTLENSCPDWPGLDRPEFQFDGFTAEHKDGSWIFGTWITVSEA